MALKSVNKTLFQIAEFCSIPMIIPHSGIPYCYSSYNTWKSDTNQFTAPFGIVSIPCHSLTPMHHWLPSMGSITLHFQCSILCIRCLLHTHRIVSSVSLLSFATLSSFNVAMWSLVFFIMINMKGNSEEPDTLFRFCEPSTSRLVENTFQSEGHTVYICQFECNEIHTLSHEHHHITSYNSGDYYVTYYCKSIWPAVQTTGIWFPVL